MSARIEYDWHTCHFCGDDVNRDGYATDGRGGLTRHWLSDCRPDLVKHEPGDACTWPWLPRSSCYAFQDRATLEWGNEHIHFYEDGPL